MGVSTNAGDVYTQMGEIVQNKFPPDSIGKLTNRVPGYEEGPLKYLLMDRALIKRPIMTVPYGVINLGMAEQIKDKAEITFKHSFNNIDYYYKINPKFDLTEIPNSYKAKDNDTEYLI